MPEQQSYLFLTQKREVILSEIYMIFAEMFPDDAQFWGMIAVGKSQRVSLMAPLVDRDREGTLTCAVAVEDLQTLASFVEELHVLHEMLKFKPDTVTKVISLQMALYFENISLEQSQSQLTFLDDDLLPKALKAISYEIEMGLETVRQMAENFYVFYKMAPQTLSEYRHIVDPKSQKSVAVQKVAAKNAILEKTAGVVQSEAVPMQELPVPEVTAPEVTASLVEDILQETPAPKEREKEPEEEDFEFSASTSLNDFFLDDYVETSKKGEEEDDGESIADIIASAGKGPAASPVVESSPIAIEPDAEMIAELENLKKEVANLKEENANLLQKNQELENAASEIVPPTNTESNEELGALRAELEKINEENIHLKIELENVMTAFANVTKDI